MSATPLLPIRSHCPQGHDLPAVYLRPRDAIDQMCGECHGVIRLAMRPDGSLDRRVLEIGGRDA